MTHATPSAPRRPHQWARPTGIVEDPYAWLIDKADHETLAYLAAENDHAADWFATREDEVETVFSEIKSRTKEDDTSYPVLHRGWWYASRTQTGKQYAIHTRGRTLGTADATVILDENIEAEGHDYFSLGAFDISNDSRLLAWSSDTDGGEQYTLRIRDLETGVDLDDVIEDVSSGGIAWSADGSWIFYVTTDDALRPWRVWRHKVGTPPSADVLVLEEPDERFFVGVTATRSGEWIIIEAGSKLSSETWLIPADSPTDAPVSMAARRDEVEYQVDHWGDVFAITTNLDALDFTVMLAPVSEPSRWERFIDHVEGRRITGFDCFAGFAILQRWVDAQQVIAIVGRDGSVREVHVMDEPHEVELDSNPDYDVTRARIGFESLTTPHTTAEIDVVSLDMEILKRVEVLDCDLDNYVSRRMWAPAADGTLVPVDIVHHKDTPMDGTAPTMVYGYGAYEISTPPWFAVWRLSMLDRGWVWALAHPRGGGELGRTWYLEGKLLSKKNTFTDTIACVDHLVSTGISHEDRVVVMGGSAGGLLVGACVTMAPQKFAGAVAMVPFVDVVNTMADPTLPLTVTEWEEWGDPRSEPHASYIESYSPYDNVSSVTYPDLYVTAGLNDPRVSYHEPAKWVARIRHDSPTTRVVFKCEMGAGHGGPSGRYERWRDDARMVVFARSCVD